MKLGSLKTAIRESSTPPKAMMSFAGKALTLTLQKTPLLDELSNAFPGGKAVETGLALNEEGFLTVDTSAQADA